MVIQSNAAQCNATCDYSMVQRSRAQHGTLRHSKVQYITARYSTERYSAIQDCTVHRNTPRRVKRAPQLHQENRGPTVERLDQANAVSKVFVIMNIRHTSGLKIRNGMAMIVGSLSRMGQHLWRATMLRNLLTIIIFNTTRDQCWCVEGTLFPSIQPHIIV